MLLAESIKKEKKVTIIFYFIPL